MMKRLLTTALMAGLLFFAATPSIAAVISLEPSVATVIVGQTFDVTVNAALEAWENITTVDFDIAYDPTVLSYDPSTGLAPNPTWGDNDFASSVKDPEVANMYGSTFETDLDWQHAQESILLITFTFEVLTAAGPTDLTFGDSRMFYNEDDPIAGVDLQLNNAQVSAVPVPAAVWLLGSGLIALCGIRKR